MYGHISVKVMVRSVRGKILCVGPESKVSKHAGRDNKERVPVLRAQCSRQEGLTKCRTPALVKVGPHAEGGAKPRVY